MESVRLYAPATQVCKMKIQKSVLKLLLCMFVGCFFCFPLSSLAKEITAKLIDGLGRPIHNAQIDLYMFVSNKNDNVQQVDLAKLYSDKSGIVRGSYSDVKVPKNKEIWVAISKSGYCSHKSLGWRSEFVLKEKFFSSDIDRVANLEGDVQLSELRDLLAGELYESNQALNVLLFTQEHKLRSPLRKLTSDEHVGRLAAQSLAFIGMPEDVRYCLENAYAVDKEYHDKGYSIVSALLDPATDQEWEFLRSCAFNALNDRWIDAGAIVTLKLIASPRSRKILDEAMLNNEYRVQLISNAIEYIDSNPSPIEDIDLLVAGQEVAKAIGIRNWSGNKEPTFNLNGDMAIIECMFTSGRDFIVYTATFHKISNVWKLRGVRETMQILLGLKQGSN